MNSFYLSHHQDTFKHNKGTGISFLKEIWCRAHELETYFWAKCKKSFLRIFFCTEEKLQLMNSYKLDDFGWVNQFVPASFLAKFFNMSKSLSLRKKSETEKGISRRLPIKFGRDRKARFFQKFTKHSCYFLT